MIHERRIREETDGFLATAYFPGFPVVDLRSPKYPYGWPVKANTDYLLTYDDATADVHMRETP